MVALDGMHWHMRNLSKQINSEARIAVYTFVIPQSPTSSSLVLCFWVIRL